MCNDSCSGTRSWVILLTVVLAGMFYLSGQRIAARQESATPPTITVTGDGKVSATPDIASLSFGVQTGRRASAKEALAVLSKQMNAAFDAVKKEGIAEKDISTEQFSLSPVYDWSNNRQNLIGYEANQWLRVKVRDLDKVADVLTAATNAGANQAGNVDFTIDDPEKAMADAREKAIERAKDRAETLAKQLGLKLGAITSYSESTGGYTPPIAMMKREAYGAMDAAASAPMPVGEQDVNISVTITYALQ